MRVLLVTIFVAQVVALASACREDDERQSSRPIRNTAESLILFARSPSEETWEAVPLAATVRLGLGDELILERSAQELRDPQNWRLALSLFRGRSGTSSALELIASERGPLTKSDGRHRHCVAPPMPPPPSVARLRRVWIQPATRGGCLAWWTVDAFVNHDGEIRAVTIDFWEP